MMMKVNKDRKIKNPFPIFPILKARNSFISLPNTPPKIEGDVKKPKNKEIQTIARIPSEKPFLQKTMPCQRLVISPN